MDIVERIAIVWNQNASIVVAGKLNFVDINFVHWGNKSLAIRLDHSFSWRHWGCCEFGIDIWADISVATDGQELHVVWVVRHNSLRNHIVVRVAVIWDKNASIVIAGEFDLVCIDLVHSSYDCLSIKLNDCFSRTDCCSSKFGINIGGHFNISSNFNKFDAVSANWLALWSLRVQM